MGENKELNGSRDPRNKNRVVKIINGIGVILFGVVFLAIAVYFLIWERPVRSRIEKRTLAKFPDFSAGDYFSGKYTKDIGEWYTDTAPGRETMKNYVADIRSRFGYSYDEANIHGVKLSPDNNRTSKKEPNYNRPAVTTGAVTSASAAGGTTVSSVSTTEVTTTAAVTEEEDDPLDDPNINGEISNNILVYHNRGIMLFGGSYENGKRYAKYLNSYKKDLGDVNVYSMVCPTPVSFYLPKKYADMTNSEKDNIDNINEYLDGVTPIDAISALDKHKKEKIYQNTDHHWSHLGAYYAAEEFAHKANVPFADISQYEENVRDGYVGTLYGYTGDSDLKNNPEEFVYYIPKADYRTEYFKTDFSERWDGNLILNIDSIDVTDWYCVFMGTDMVVTHVNTDVKNGRKLAVIKDSYGNALIPWFTSSFEDIYVIDMRYFETNVISKLKEWGVTDLLFAMSSYSATGANYEHLEVLRTQ